MFKVGLIFVYILLNNIKKTIKLWSKFAKLTKV